MTLDPDELAKDEPGGAPHDALLDRLVRAHRNGRPDDAEMEALATRLGPLLKEVPTPARLPSWIAPAALSAVLAVTTAGWLLSRTNAAPVSSGLVTAPADVHLEEPKEPMNSLEPKEAQPPAVLPVATGSTTMTKLEPSAPALSVHALPDLATPAPSREATQPRIATAGATRSAKGTSEKVTATSSCEDVALIERAGAELRSGQAERALASTRQHQERCPDGVLAQERERIAIEALALLGRRDEARARAASFESRYPSSPHLRRVRQVIGTVPE